MAAYLQGPRGPGRPALRTPSAAGQERGLYGRKYIVVVNKDVSTDALDDATINTYSSNADRIHNSTIRSFAGGLCEAAFEELRNHPGRLEKSRDSHRENVGGNGSSRSSNYYFDDSAGAGTCSYIIDTGIDVAHVEFGGRTEFLRNFSGDRHDGDCTYVAGIKGSDTSGVAKKTRLSVQRPRHGRRARPVESGTFVAVASGNDGRDATGVSPASAPKVCTVGATNVADARSGFSNYGAVVDVFAPGEDTYHQHG
ncbi:hypothetical protein SLS62_003369 [Diatrype stigma]|uniref:Peptidase S8/S53 domain-containing protein n=1 Tax=Diatrype stigma TaxID=117547 RepID=A0AAN9UV72_9PEZI